MQLGYPIAFNKITSKNDQDSLNKANPVQGFYSNDEVNLLIEALLKK